MDDSGFTDCDKRLGLDPAAALGAGPRDDSEGADAVRFVEVLYARSADEAAGCRHLLEGRNIPARVESSPPAARGSGIAVLVPSDRLVEASELLAARVQEDDDFDDDGCDDEDEDADELDDDFDDDDDCDDAPGESKDKDDDTSKEDGDF